MRLKVIDTAKINTSENWYSEKFISLIRDFANKSYYQHLHLNFIIRADPESFEKLTFPMSKNWKLIEKSKTKNKVSNLYQKIP